MQLKATNKSDILFSVIKYKGNTSIELIFAAEKILLYRNEATIHQKAVGSRIRTWGF